MTSYSHPQKITAVRVGKRVILESRQNDAIENKVALDRVLFQLWEYANGRTLEEILGDFPDWQTPAEIRAGLACLAEAGLLIRDSLQQAAPPPASIQGKLVSVVLVSFDSANWLVDCLASLARQSFQSSEWIVFDNGSTDHTTTWLTQNYPQVRLLRADTPLPFTQALNRSLASAKGEYLLLLNPDVILSPDAINQMVQVAESQPDCAAIAPKLKFLWSPAFINGIGNRVRRFFWGVDNGIGHLDLGQFDGWSAVPSVCFAAALIPRQVWESSGGADENISMYYEDSEWSYRVRLSGKKIYAAPKAIVYHALGSRIPSGNPLVMTITKYEQVVFGRLWLTFKIWGNLQRICFLLCHAIEDSLRSAGALLQGRVDIPRAIWKGWKRFLSKQRSHCPARRKIQHARQVTDKDLLAVQADMPETLLWRGIPELSWDLIQTNYLPLIRAGKTQSLVEFTGFEIKQSSNRIGRLYNLMHEPGVNISHGLRRLQGWITRG